MIDANLREQVLTKFDVLPVDQQRQVLEFALNLPRPVDSVPQGTRGRDLLPFAGIISSADADAMMQAIEDSGMTRA